MSIKSQFMLKPSRKHIFTWANKTVCLRTGTHVPINSRREEERKPDVYFHSCSFTASCPCGWLPVYIRKGKSWAESIKQQKSSRNTPPLECLRFFVVRGNTIVEQFEQKKKNHTHTHTQAHGRFRMWCYYSKDLGVVIVICHLPLKCRVLLFFF